MSAVRSIVSQPVTVTVGVILVLLAGVISLQHIPIQLTPNVEETVVSVTTAWEGASPEEVEKDIIDEQEDKLQGVANLVEMTSESQQGLGTIRLEFAVGTSIDDALREVGDKLREVPEYPENADEPVIEGSDPENRDYIAWIVFGTTDPDFDIRTLQDFAEDRIKPVLDRVEGMSEVNVLGGREHETQIRFSPTHLAQYGITPNALVTALQRANRNVSAGELSDAKSEIRLRTVSQYDSVHDIEQTIITHTDSGPIFVRDVADVVETYKEPSGFVRSRGVPVIAVNAQREVGSNVIAVMDGLKEKIAQLTAPGGALEIKAKQLGLDGELFLEQVYDQTIYIDDALALVRSNIWLGGALAILVLLLFLRSLRSVGIIAVAIPISIIGAVVVMVALGRSVNVISLAGMAFAIGMVVDNAIVVLENIFRHLEMGKRPRQAAIDATSEVWLAILASTLTTVAVFIPILLIQEDAGQLFRDIALALCAALMLSLLVAVTVVPTAAARLLRPMAAATDESAKQRGWKFLRWAYGIPNAVSGFIYLICGSVIARVAIVGLLTFVSVFGTIALMPPSDYLPTGNRNLIFGLLIPPPGYNVEQLSLVGERVEEFIRPYWEAGKLDPESQEYEQAKANLPSIPTFDRATGQPGPTVIPPPVENYFFVAFGDVMFHGAVSAEPQRVADTQALMNYATSQPGTAPGVISFAFQVPLFRTGGSSGSAVKIDFVADNIDSITRAAQGIYVQMGQRFGFHTIQPSPGNFNIFGPEIQVIPNLRALADVSMTPADLAMAVQANGDGAIIGEYRTSGDTIDLKLIAQEAVDREVVVGLQDIPVATPTGHVVPLSSLATLERTTSPPQINHSGRQRSVTLQFTPPESLPLEQAIAEVQTMLREGSASGVIPPDVGVGLTGSASKLQAIQHILLGDGTFVGMLGSSLFLALVIVYLLMCLLFQSFVNPLVIMFSVPLATVGGFLALYAVYMWSLSDRYMPVQKLDVLTMLGFIILIGVVVNNAILIVHQAINFMAGTADVSEGAHEKLPPRRAIAEAVRTRIRPIFMTALTSAGGMLPLVLMPGSGSELYRGLGSVVVGGLLVSTIFTIVLVPLLFSLVVDVQGWLARKPQPAAGASAAPATRNPNGRS